MSCIAPLRKKRPKTKVASRKIIRAEGAAHAAFLTSRQQNRWKVGRGPDLHASYNPWAHLQAAALLSKQERVKATDASKQANEKAEQKEDFIFD